MKSRLHLTQKPPHQGNKRRKEEVLFVKTKKSLVVIFKRQGNLHLALTALGVAILIVLGSVDEGAASSSGAMPRTSFAIAQKTALPSSTVRNVWKQVYQKLPNLPLV